MRIDPAALEARYDDLAAAPPPSFEQGLPGATAEVLAAHVLILDAVNFGSGWFPTLAKRTGADGRPLSGARTVAAALTDRARAHGPWSPAQLSALRTEEVADVLGQPRDHELMSLYAQALRSLGTFLGPREPLELVDSARGSAVTLAEALAGGMAMFADPGFYKRAQITPSDLALSGAARFGDLDELTIFADNLVPHVLRCDGVLVYDDDLAAHVDAGRLLGPGRAEREIRACAVHVCEQLARRLELTPRELDARLWWRGQGAAYKARPRHRCRCVAY